MAENEFVEREDETVNEGPEPEAVGASRFRIVASYDRGSQIGWWTDRGMWGSFEIVATDEINSTIWELIEYKGLHYLKKGTDNYLGWGIKLKMVNWIAADAWQFEGDYLKCIKNNHFVGFRDGFFYLVYDNRCEVKRFYIDQSA